MLQVSRGISSLHLGSGHIPLAAHRQATTSHLFQAAAVTQRRLATCRAVAKGMPIPSVILHRSGCPIQRCTCVPVMLRNRRRNSGCSALSACSPLSACSLLCAALHHATLTSPPRTAMSWTFVSGVPKIPVLRSWTRQRRSRLT